MRQKLSLHKPEQPGPYREKVLTRSRTGEHAMEGNLAAADVDRLAQ